MDEKQEAPAIGNLPQPLTNKIHDYLLPEGQQLFTCLNKRHFRWFFEKDQKIRDIFNQEQLRVKLLIEKHQKESPSKLIVHQNFIPLLADVFEVEQDIFHTTETFQMALVHHARQLTPPNEWYQFVPFSQTVRKNTLALQMSKNNDFFEYTVITPGGKKVTDSIYINALKNYQFEMPLTIEQLERVKSAILEITESRKHTFKALGKHLFGQLEIKNYSWFDTKNNDALLHIEFEKLSLEAVQDLALIYQNYYNMKVDISKINWVDVERHGIIFSRQEFCQKCLPYFNTGPLRRLYPHQQYQKPVEKIQRPGIWENYCYGMYSNQNHLWAEQLSDYFKNSSCSIS